MSEWIDVGVYTALLTMVWFVFPNIDWRTSLPHLTQRNPDWLARAEAAKRFKPSRWAVGLCYLVGTASVAALVACQLERLPETLYAFTERPDKWSVLATITSWSILLFGGLILLGSVALSARVRSEVPLPEERRATLGPRSMDDFVPRWIRVVIYTLVVAHLSVWVVVAALDLYINDVFWRRIASPFFFHGVAFFFARWAVKRPPSAPDRMVGFGHRAPEIHFAFAMQIFLVYYGGLMLYESLAATPAFNVPRVFALSAASFTLLGGVGFALGANKLGRIRTHVPRDA